MEKANKGRLEKQLNKLFRDVETNEIYTLKTRILNGYFSSVRTYTEEYSKRKINGCYAKLKNPRTIYVLNHADNELIGTPVPKLVAAYADSMIELNQMRKDPKAYCSNEEPLVLLNEGV